jgi:hypothetical protein
MIPCLKGRFTLRNAQGMPIALIQELNCVTSLLTDMAKTTSLYVHYDGRVTENFASVTDSSHLTSGIATAYL